MKSSAYTSAQFFLMTLMLITRSLTTQRVNSSCKNVLLDADIGALPAGVGSNLIIVSAIFSIWVPKSILLSPESASSLRELITILHRFSSLSPEINPMTSLHPVLSRAFQIINANNLIAGHHEKGTVGASHVPTCLWDVSRDLVRSFAPAISFPTIASKLVRSAADQQYCINCIFQQ